jgi:hypothetical protein
MYVQERNKKKKEKQRQQQNVWTIAENLKKQQERKGEKN